jgi:hypothetical protein
MATHNELVLRQGRSRASAAVGPTVSCPLDTLGHQFLRQVTRCQGASAARFPMAVIRTLIETRRPPANRQHDAPGGDRHSREFPAGTLGRATGRIIDSDLVHAASEVAERRRPALMTSIGASPRARSAKPNQSFGVPDHPVRRLPRDRAPAPVQPELPARGACLVARAA